MRLYYLLAALVCCSSAFAQTSHGGAGAPLLLIVLASIEERQQLEKDILSIEQQDWDSATLEQQLSDWASQRNLLLQKDVATGFHMAVSRRLVRDSFQGEQLTIARLLRSALNDSRAIPVHEQPEPLRTALQRVATQGEAYPMAFFKITEASPTPKYLMPGAVVYVELPVGDERIQVQVEHIFSDPSAWGALADLPRTLPQQENPPAKRSPEAMVILRSQFAALRIDVFQDALKRMIELWVGYQEQIREQYAQEMADMRNQLKRIATEQTGLPVDTELDWTMLPQGVAKTILEHLQRSGYSLSEADLAGKRIRCGIAMRLHVARVHPDSVWVFSLPLDGDYGAVTVHSYPRAGR